MGGIILEITIGEGGIQGGGADGTESTANFRRILQRGLTAGNITVGISQGTNRTTTHKDSTARADRFTIRNVEIVHGQRFHAGIVHKGKRATLNRGFRTGYRSIGDGHSTQSGMPLISIYRGGSAIVVLNGILDLPEAGIVVSLCIVKSITHIHRLGLTVRNLCQVGIAKGNGSAFLGRSIGKRRTGNRDFFRFRSQGQRTANSRLGGFKGTVGDVNLIGTGICLIRIHKNTGKDIHSTAVVIRRLCTGEGTAAQSQFTRIATHQNCATCTTGSHGVGEMTVGQGNLLDSTVQTQSTTGFCGIAAVKITVGQGEILNPCIS